GRVDDQVKIRGVRVEPREVEDALTGYPLIASCAVTVRPDRDGEPSLVAYVVSETEYPPAIPEMRAYLRERLPLASVPARFVRLASLPLSANGKIDRRALVALGDRPDTPPPSSSPPQTPFEMALAAQWEAILGLPSVGVHDHFLDLGGHSLAAMRLAAALRDAGVCEMSVRDVFDYPTIAPHAALIDARLPSP